MKKTLLFLLLIISQKVIAQSTEIKPGNILPKMTTAQRTGMATPADGMLVYDSNTLSYWYRQSGSWVELPKGGSTSNYWSLTGAGGNEIKNTNSGGFWSANPTGLTGIETDITNPPAAPTIGSGTRLMWIPSRSAFRVGSVDGNSWDPANIGLFSIASGFGTVASGNTSSAFGYQSVASGYFSTAMGNQATASGYFSTAMGNHTIASGTYSTAMGFNTNASQPYTTAMGLGTTASGLYSTAMGIITTANGEGSTALGYNIITSGNYSTALGKYNVDNLNALFIIGNGTSDIARKNIFVIRGDNDRVGIGTDNPIAHLHVVGSGAVATAQSSYFYPNSTALSNNVTSSAALSIYASHGIVSATYVGAALNVISSDARIKNIIGRSSNATDLETIIKLKITDYQMKDEGTWGKKTFKKIIAQEVEEVYPDAVSKQTSVIPDIYALAESVTLDATKKELTLVMAKSYDLIIGDKVELVHPTKGKIRSTISAVNGNAFTVKDWIESAEKIFVFGREVDDFRVVDYEAISMLGISAIQQLVKENEVMKSELQKLKLEQNIKIEALFKKVEELSENQNLKASAIYLPKTQ